MRDRYRLNLFCSGYSQDTDRLYTQEITQEVFSTNALRIALYSVDFPDGTSMRYRKNLEKRWIDTLPQLDAVKALSVRHRVKQDFFEAICKMKQLQSLHIESSQVEDISSISKLQQLRRLDLYSFSRLKDIQPILKLKNLELLSIQNSFKIENYDLIGKMTSLIGLNLEGDTIAPRNLRLQSLKPFNQLKNLRHLNISYLSVIDGSYEEILALEQLERLDLTICVSKPIREKIKAEHKKLCAGSFMDWDFYHKKLYYGKEW